MPETQITPEVSWAQRSSSTDASKNYLYVNLVVADVPKSAADIKITPNNVTFTGTTLKGTKFHVSLDLYAEIDPENSKVNHTSRGVELVLRKKELKQEFWPRLLKESKKVHFLKTDFDKWVDEDEQDEAPEEDYANNFGGFGGDEGGLGGIDFSKLGGAGDLGGAGGFGADAGEEDGSDEDLPELEGDKSAGHNKIEEVA